MKKSFMIFLVTLAVMSSLFAIPMWVFGEISNARAGIIWLNGLISIKLFDSLYKS